MQTDTLHTPHGTCGVYLGRVAIDPDLSGRGYGTAMLQEIIGYARAKGFRRIELSVTVGNDTAKKLYEKVGFLQEGVLREFAFPETENRYADEILMFILIRLRMKKTAKNRIIHNNLRTYLTFAARYAGIMQSASTVCYCTPCNYEKAQVVRKISLCKLLKKRMF